MSPKGTKKPLGAEVESEDIHIHVEPLSESELKKIEKKEKKALKKQMNAEAKAAKKAEKAAKKEHKYIAKHGGSSSPAVQHVSTPAVVVHTSTTGVHSSPVSLTPSHQTQHHETVHSQTSWQSGAMKSSPMVA